MAIVICCGHERDARASGSDWRNAPENAIQVIEKGIDLEV